MNPPSRGHPKSNTSLAIAPNHRGLSVGHRAPLSAAGPGRILWCGLSRSSSGDGHQRGCYRAAVSPWQNPYVERLIGSIRRECLDHISILNEHHLRGVPSQYFQYHHTTRTHLSLSKDCPQPRRIQSPSVGKIVAFPEVGGLHHRYERRAA